MCFLEITMASLTGSQMHIQSFVMRLHCMPVRDSM